jgi:hypothetical protein
LGRYPVPTALQAVELFLEHLSFNTGALKKVKGELPWIQASAAQM